MKKSLCFTLILLGLSPLTSHASLVEDMLQSTLFVHFSCKASINQEEIELGQTGSGFLIGDGQYVITNQHVIPKINCNNFFREQLDMFIKAGKIKKDDIKEVKIISPEPIIKVVLSPKESIPVQVLWRGDWAGENDFEGIDLAILKLEHKLSRPSVSFAKYEAVNAYDKVIAIGFPGASAPQWLNKESNLTPKITQGVVSAKVKSNPKGICFYQTDAPISGGNSGGPLFNQTGQVIGINTQKSATSGVEGIAWAICIDEIISALKQLNIPYQDSGPGIFDYLRLSIEQSPSQTTALALILILVLGTLFIVLFTRQGRRIVIKGVEYSTTMIADAIRRKPDPPILSKSSPAPSPVTQPVLRGLAGTFIGQVFPLTASGGAISLGRDATTSQIIFPDSATQISRDHAEIRFDPQTQMFLLKDHGSTHGTFLDSGERLTTGRTYSLAAGSLFYLGDKSNQFRIEMQTSTVSRESAPRSR